MKAGFTLGSAMSSASSCSVRVMRQQLNDRKHGCRVLGGKGMNPFCSEFRVYAVLGPPEGGTPNLKSVTTLEKQKRALGNTRFYTQRPQPNLTLQI
jgi:hypothetical protein